MWRSLAHGNFLQILWSKLNRENSSIVPHHVTMCNFEYLSLIRILTISFPPSLHSPTPHSLPASLPARRGCGAVTDADDLDIHFLSCPKVRLQSDRSNVWAVIVVLGSVPAVLALALALALALLLALILLRAVILIAVSLRLSLVLLAVLWIWLLQVLFVLLLVPVVPEVVSSCYKSYEWLNQEAGPVLVLAIVFTSTSTALRRIPKTITLPVAATILCACVRRDYQIYSSALSSWTRATRCQHAQLCDMQRRACARWRGLQVRVLVPVLVLLIVILLVL